MVGNMQGVGYQFGHADWSYGTGPWFDFKEIGVEEDGGLKTAFWFLGDEADGPLAVCLESPPNPTGAITAQAHSHASDQVRLIVAGSLKIGTTWYRAGDIRFQQAGKIYGPEVPGPDGCRELLFFDKRSAIIPRHVREADDAPAAVSEGFLELMTKLARATAP